MTTRMDARFVRMRAPLVALTLAGCGGTACPTATYPSAPALLDAYGRMRRFAEVVRAEARVDRRDGSGRVKGTVLMYLERPDRVRLDVVTQLGPAAILTTDGERFALTDFRRRTFSTGPACRTHIEAYLGVPLAPESVVRLLLGESPETHGDARPLVCEDGSYRADLVQASGDRQSMRLTVRERDLGRPPGQQRLRLRESEVTSPTSDVRWRVAYDDFRVIPDPKDQAEPQRGVAMPFSIRFEDPRHGSDTLVRFRSVELNVEVPDGLFRQQARPGFAAAEVPCP